MSLTSTLILRLKEADEADYGKSVVRIHEANKPQNINWGDRIHISLDRKNWITCKLEPAGRTGIERIYIGIHLRGILNRDTIGIEIAKLEVPCNFYIRKASSWKVPLYAAIGILVTIAVAFLVYFLDLTGC